MWIGNLMLVIINLPLIGIWVQLLRVPYRLLYPGDPAVLRDRRLQRQQQRRSTCCSRRCFGVLGYVFIRLECEPAPLLLGFVLGPLMEENLRRAMRISRGDPMIFVNRPISLGLLIAAALLLLLVALPAIRCSARRCSRRGEASGCVVVTSAPFPDAAQHEVMHR